MPSASSCLSFSQMARQELCGGRVQPCPTNPHFRWNSLTCLWSGQSASCCLVTQKCFQYLEPAAPPSRQLVWVAPNCLESPTNVPPSPPWLSSTAEPNSKMGQEPNSQTMQTEAPGWPYPAGSGLLSLICFLLIVSNPGIIVGVPQRTK